MKRKKTQTEISHYGVVRAATCLCLKNTESFVSVFSDYLYHVTAKAHIMATGSVGYGSADEYQVS